MNITEVFILPDKKGFPVLFLSQKRVDKKTYKVYNVSWCLIKTDICVKQPYVLSLIIKERYYGRKKHRRPGKRN